VQDRVEVPDPPVILVEERVHDRLVEFVVTARVTIPVKPFIGATLMLDVLIAPAFTVTLVGLALTLKSWTMNATVTEWDREGLVPVTVTCMIAAEANVHDSVELPEPVSLVGVRVQAVLLLTRLTTPPKPFNPVIVIVEVARLPALMVTLVGLAAIVKSWTVKVTVAE
jgi:hypothetical protein